TPSRPRALTALANLTSPQRAERLEQRGQLPRSPAPPGVRGPPATPRAFLPTSPFVVGFDVGPEHALAACADITGTVVGRIEQTTHDTDDPVGVVHRAVIEAARSGKAPISKVRRVVLGSPGLVDPDTGDLSFVL